MHTRTWQEQWDDLAMGKPMTGLCLLEFARSHHLTLANILHPHKLSRTATWHSPNGQVHNQIDFILTLQCANTRMFPGADISSNHDLVLATFKLRLKARCCLKCPCIWCLTSRLQYVRLNGLLSTAIRTNTGAPQGTVLAPFLFALYTDDCRSTYESCPVVIFADDTDLVGKISNDEGAVYHKQIENFVNWCDKNYSYLNVA